MLRTSPPPAALKRSAYVTQNSARKPPQRHLRPRHRLGTSAQTPEKPRKLLLIRRPSLLAAIVQTPRILGRFRIFALLPGVLHTREVAGSKPAVPIALSGAPGPSISPLLSVAVQSARSLSARKPLRGASAFTREQHSRERARYVPIRGGWALLRTWSTDPCAATEHGALGATKRLPRYRNSRERRRWRANGRLEPMRGGRCCPGIASARQYAALRFTRGDCARTGVGRRWRVWMRAAPWWWSSELRWLPTRRGRIRRSRRLSRCRVWQGSRDRPG